MASETPASPTPRKTRWTDDYIDLFGGIFPTSIHVLERNGNFLFIRHMDYAQTVAPAQDKLFKRLVNYGKLDAAPGDVSVFCVWGITSTRRELMTYEGGDPEGPFALTTEEYRVRLRTWWLFAGLQR